MIHHVLAVDYDGTLAHEGFVDDPTVEALGRVRESGRKLIMVTGRLLESLRRDFSKVDYFECVVAENGALLYWPEADEVVTLAEPLPPEFAHALRHRGVDYLEIGHVIVATWSPHEQAILDAIRELGLELQIIFNKGAVMVLPSGVNKAYGLRAALTKLGVSPMNTVAVGDAENDLSMLALCGTSAAVANALPAVKKSAAIDLANDHGAGVAELSDRLIENDLKDVACRLDRGIEYGVDLQGSPLRVSAFGESLLVVGGPGGGKSRFATSLWERLVAAGFQTCIVDPEGDYQTTDEAVVVGTKEQPPTVEETLEILSGMEKDCIVSLFSMPKEDRPKFFGSLLRALLEYRSRTGRPHWIIVDEAHYAAPANWKPAEELNPDELRGVVFITAFQEKLSDTAFRAGNLFVAIGDEPREALKQCFERLGKSAPPLPPPEDRQEHRALSWHRGDETTTWFRRNAPRTDLRRHLLDNFAGELDEEQRFCFRGPDNRVNLPANNLKLFIQLAEGVDDETWEYHLRRHDYSKWFRDVIKDEELAAAAEAVEGDGDLSDDECRQRIVESIRNRYEEAD